MFSADGILTNGSGVTPLEWSENSGYWWQSTEEPHKEEGMYGNASLLHLWIKEDIGPALTSLLYNYCLFSQ